MKTSANEILIIFLSDHVESLYLLKSKEKEILKHQEKSLEMLFN